MLTTDKTDWVGAISLSGEGAPVIATATAREVKLASGATLPFPGRNVKHSSNDASILPVDFSYDFKTDLVLAGAGGVRLFRQDSPAAFTDVTAATKLPATVVNASTRQRGPRTSKPTAISTSCSDPQKDCRPSCETTATARFSRFILSPAFGLADFAWADLDADGDPDAALIDRSGTLHVFSNERQGQFTKRSAAESMLTARATQRAGHKQRRRPRSGRRAKRRQHHASF